MRTVLVTGAAGFIGKNLCTQLALDKEIAIIPFDRDNSVEDLKVGIAKSDFVFHLAGINRTTDESEFDKGNRGLTEDVLSTIKETGKKIPILLTSSIHAQLDNAYGKSKKAAEEAIFAWSKDNDNPVFVYRLPNVFGKWCRPNYNSAVATFCNNIANGLDITVNDPSIELTLVYIDTVVSDFIRTLNGEVRANEDGFCEVSRTFNATLGEITSKLYSFKKIHETLVVPNFEDDFNRALYATFTSYFDKDDFAYTLDKKSDDRGWLAEFIKSEQFGAVFVSKTKPGISRGNHWHHTKIEKFLVIDGQADIKFRLKGSDEVITFSVNGEEPKVVDIPAGYVHSITNTGTTDLTTLFWANEILDQNKPDTYYEEV